MCELKQRQLQKFWCWKEEKKSTQFRRKAIKEINLEAESEIEEDDIFTNIERIIRDSDNLNVKFRNIEIPNLLRLMQ